MRPPAPRHPVRQRTRLAAVVPVLAVGFGLAGCHTPPGVDRGAVSGEVEARFGQSVGPPTPLDDVLVPPGLALGQPLAEDHAVLLALWNNPLFQEQLVDLQLARADLVQAGLLPNPELLYYFSAPNKPFRYLVDFPIESLWLRPLRVKAAAAENARAASRLTQLALDLIRDTRQAHADLVLARDRVRVAGESVRFRSRLADLAAARLEAGEATPQEAATARIDALQARQDAARIGYEVTLAGERLKNLCGLGRYTFPLVPADAPAGPTPAVGDDPDPLVQDAVFTRPDSKAAADAAAGAAERVRVAKISWVRFLGILDATTGTKTDHEFGPGFRVTLPIFNRNQGGIARAEAEAEVAERRRRTVHQQVILDVRLAHARYRQAAAELGVLRESVRPEVEASVRRAETAYKEGNAGYVLVLEAARQVIDTDFREAQLAADLRRATAELERSVGRRLDRPPAAGCPTPNPVPPAPTP